MSKTYFSISQQNREADIYIFGDIITYPYKPGDYSAGSLVREIQALDADVINVHIDCYGGSVKEGWGIYNALKQCKATVNTYADGFVASAALYPFLAGKKRIASAVSAFYLHQVRMGASGYAADLREAADEAEKMTQIGIQAFVETTGSSEEKIWELMQKESWLDPKEALALKIATAISTLEGDAGYSQSARMDVVQKLIHPGEEQREQEPPPEPAEPTNIFSKFFA